MEKYDAIIIGSGIGGLSAGLMLAHKKKKVLIIEKNNILGGRISSYQKGDFQVDIGVHIISRSEKGPIGEVLRRVGIEDPIKYTKVRPVTSYNGEIFIFPHSLKGKVSDKDYDAVMRFLKDIRAMSEEEVSKHDDMFVDELLSKYTDNTLIQACITNIVSIYLCLPAWKASAGEFMRCLRWESKEKSSGYPIGGCKVISDVYADGIKSFGGEILTNVAVKKINIENGKATGVIADGEFYKSDIVISNADIKQTVTNLVGEEYFDEDYVKSISDLKYSWSGTILKLGLNKEITDIKMLTQFGEIDQKKYYEKLSAGIIPDELNLFVVIPSNFSPGIAPKGSQMMNIGTMIPIDTPAETQLKLEDAMFKTMEKYVPNVRDHIEWKNYMTVKDIDSIFGEDGAGIGIGQRPGQVGKKRPDIKSTVDGLYFVSAEAGGAGVGTEMAANSALEFIDEYFGDTE